jgi:hypothetical protein
MNIIAILKPKYEWDSSAQSSTNPHQGVNAGIAQTALDFALSAPDFLCGRESFRPNFGQWPTPKPN